MIKRICAHPRCNKVIDDTTRYCEYHAVKHNLKVKEYYNNYNNKNSNNKIRKFYWTNTWKETRHNTLISFYYIDVYKLIFENEIVVADIVHHIVPSDEQFSLRIAPDNLIPVSDETHRTIHKEYNKGTREKLKMQKKLIQCRKLFIQLYKT